VDDLIVIAASRVEAHKSAALLTHHYRESHVVVCATDTPAGRAPTAARFSSAGGSVANRNQLRPATLPSAGTLAEGASQGDYKSGVWCAGELNAENGGFLGVPQS
jgi:hypothetical protein